MLIVCTLLLAVGFSVSCGSGGGGTKTTTNQTYAFFLESKPAVGIVIDTPLTLTVQTAQ